MSNANPTKSMARPNNWYGPKTESPGLTPAPLKTPTAPVTQESLRCSCGTKVWLLNGTTEVACSCGAVVRK